MEEEEEEKTPFKHYFLQKLKIRKKNSIFLGNVQQFQIFMTFDEGKFYR